jgi:hypothetical protein
MVRTVHDVPHHVVFERAEVDGRQHAAWVLDVALVELPDQPGLRPTTRLAMSLHYGGALWTGALLQRVLDDHVRRGSEALAALAGAEPQEGNDAGHSNTQP